MSFQFERRFMSVPALATVAGFVDAVCYLSLNVFTAHMSGNSARLGVYLGRGAYHDVLVAAFAVLVFVTSITAGTAVMEMLVRRGSRRPEATLLIAEAVLLAIFTAVGVVSGRSGVVPAHPAYRFYGLVACAVAAIGLQTSCLQSISGQTVRTTYVSGMLTNLADELVTLVLARTPHHASQRPSFVRDDLDMPSGSSAIRRLLLLAAIWSGYVAGAIAGAFAHSAWHLASMTVPIGLLAVVSVTGYVLQPR